MRDSALAPSDVLVLFVNWLRPGKMEFSNTIRSKLLPTATALVLFFVVSALYFAPQFRGEVLPQHDVIQYEGMAKDISDMRAALLISMPTGQGIQ